MMTNNTYATIVGKIARVHISRDAAIEWMKEHEQFSEIRLTAVLEIPFEWSFIRCENGIMVYRIR